MVITAKSEGLWDFVNDLVSREDIRHMQSRVSVFTATAQIAGALEPIAACGACFGTWLVEEASAMAVGAPMLPIREVGSQTQWPQPVRMFLERVLVAAKLQHRSQLIYQWCADEGVAEVREIVEGVDNLLEAVRLKPFEQQRLRTSLGTAGA